MIHQDDFEDYKSWLLSFIAHKIERSCALYVFVFSLIFFSGKSQIYQKENTSIYITKGTTLISENHIIDSSSSVKIYIVDGTTINGLQENIKSKILVTYSKNKSFKKSLKLIISKKSKVIIASKIEETNPKIIFKNNSDNEKAVLLTSKFLTVVAPNSSNYDKLLSILQTDAVHFLVGFEDNILIQKSDTSKSTLNFLSSHRIRPPPCFFIFSKSCS